MTPLRIRLPFLLVLVLVPGGLRAADLDGSPPAVGDAEALRLYDDANDYVANVTEGQYSYAYMQFYWRRAETFIERAEQVYPDSPTGEALRAGRLKVGPFGLAYFRDRVLPRLEQKRLAAYDPVNCAIFLYERNTHRHDPEHTAALDDIIEVMSRQSRWGEVLGFPAQGAEHIDLLRTMFRVAVRSADDESAVVDQLLASVGPRDQAAAGFVESQAEALALLGMPRELVASFVTTHPADAVKIAVLRGMVDRELQIRRRAALRIPAGDAIQMEHYILPRLGVRDDVEAVAREFWANGRLPEPARTELGIYRAGLGRRPPAAAPLPVHLSYMDYLGAFERFDDLESYPATLRLSAGDRRTVALKMIELYAGAGRRADAERWSAPFVVAGGDDSDDAALADVRGRLESTEDPFIVRERTFADLPIHDPCVLAQAIMEWSLAPVRSIRGAAPWDAVVLRFEPGFANLPLPKSAAVRRASGALAPY